MRQFLTTDTGFYTSIGVVLIFLFASGLAVFALSSPETLESPTLIPFIVGYLLFMTSYFLAIWIYNAVPDDA
jgi:uncharacterized BrkB/YihY/UPF0761 family membrane protein